MKINYISWIPAVLIMVIIFSFSAKPADISDESSMAVVKNIVHIYETITKTDFPADKEKAMDHIVRKSAHFCIYALLSAAIAVHIALRSRLKKLIFLLPVIISFLYACTDEYHQTFVFGRSGQFKDVMLDTSGAALGSLIFILLFLKLQGKHRVNKLKTID